VSNTGIEHTGTGGETTVILPALSTPNARERAVRAVCVSKAF